MKSHTTSGRPRDTDAGGRAGSRQGQDTLAAILTTAGELASEAGLEQLSLRRLASAVGMSKSGLYAHFASKEELQLATVEHAREVFAEQVLRGSPDDDDPGLHALLERWLAFFERKAFPGGCFMIVAAVEFAHRSGAVREALTNALDGELAALESAIGHAQQTGRAPAESDARQTAFELHSVLMNAHALFHVKRDPAVFARARAAIRTRVGQPESTSETR